MKKLRAVILIFIVMILSGCQLFPTPKEQSLTSNNMAKNIRKPAVAGQFYPGTKSEIDAQFADFLSDNPEPGKPIKALVVPHAGTVYSGAVAGKAFSYLDGKSYNKVIIMAPSHHASFSGISVGDFTHYETPLGLIPVSADVKKLLSENNFDYLPQAHSREHAIEIELPFLQKTLNDFQIIPLICGNQTNLAEIKELALVLKKYIDEQTLVVASVDFTHYGPNYGFVPFTKNIPENLAKLDQPVIDYLMKFATDELYQYLSEVAITNDGQVPLTLLSELFKELDYQVEVVGRDTSGNIMGDYTNSVSYVGMIVWGDSQVSELVREYSQTERDYLLKLARNTLETYYQTGKKPTVKAEEVSEKLKEERGVFVTLEKNGNLRGCIGYILPNGPIYQAVIENTLNAALDDPRFIPVIASEVKDLTIEISILSLPSELAVSQPREYLTKLRPEIDGVIIQQGRSQATYLPQVWEDLKEPTEFLGSLCQKAGLDADCWQSSATKLLTYQAEVFKELRNEE